MCELLKKKKKICFPFVLFFFLMFFFSFCMHQRVSVFLFLFFFFLIFSLFMWIFSNFSFFTQTNIFFSKLSIRIIKPKRNQLWHKPLFECLFILQGSIRLCISCFSFHNTFVIYINMYLFSFLSLSFPFLCGNFQTFHSNTNFFFK